MPKKENKKPEAPILSKNSPNYELCKNLFGMN